MSNLIPQPIKIKLGDNEYGMMFTVKAVDDIQNRFDIAISELSKLLTNSENSVENLCYILALIINESAENQIDETSVDGFINVQNVVSIARSVFMAFSESLPESNDDDCDDGKSTEEKVNVARLLFIGKTLLGYTEAEVWSMTPRKLILLYVEYKKEHGQYEEPKNIDDVIPF